MTSPPLGAPSSPTAPGAGPLGVRLAANTLAQIVGMVLSAVIGLATFVVLTRGLDVEAFGDFTAAVAYLTLPVVLADFGLTAGVLREISQSPERIEHAMRAFVPLNAAFSLVAVSALTAAGLFLPFSDGTKLAIAIGSVGAFLTMMTIALSPVLQARLQMHWVAAASILGRLVAFGLVVAALVSGLGFASVVAATVVGVAVTFAIQLVAVLRIISLRPRIDVEYWRSLARGSFALSVASALGQVNFRAGTILLALFRPSTEVGHFGAAYRFVELASVSSGAVSVSAFPSLAHFAATGDRRFHDLVQRSFDVLLAAAAPVVLIALLFPKELLRWTAGAEYEPGALVLQLLAAYLPLAFLNQLAWRVLVAFHEDRWLLRISALALILTVVLNLVFIPLYGFEAPGAIILGVETLIAALFARLLLARRRVRPSLRYAATILGALAPSLVIALALPGPSIVAVAAALAAYTALLIAVPGTVHDVAWKLAATIRPALARR